MSNLTEYFNRKAQDLPKPKFAFGDRVSGRVAQFPFVGTVMRETDSIVLVHSDLPVQREGMISYIVPVNRSAIKLLKELE
jgi:hypothetical protein